MLGRANESLIWPVGREAKEEMRRRARRDLESPWKGMDEDDQGGEPRTSGEGQPNFPGSHHDEQRLTPISWEAGVDRKSVV